MEPDEFEFTPQQKTDITNEFNSRIELPIGQRNLHEVYQLIFDAISEPIDPMTDPSGTLGPKPGVDRSVWLFINAAANANNPGNTISDISRSYSAHQHDLRTGADTDPTDPVGIIQEASDEIAIRIIGDIIRRFDDPALPPALPTIGEIAELDAVQGSASVLWDGDVGGWVGNPLFLFFGHAQSLNDNVLNESLGTYDLLAASDSTFEALGETFPGFLTSLPALFATAVGNNVGAVGTLGLIADALVDADALLENAYGGDIADLIQTLVLAEPVLGTALPDASIVGTGGPDVIHGGEGSDSDTIIGTLGSDLIDGGGGPDTVDYSQLTLPIDVTIEDRGTPTFVPFSARVSVENPVPVMGLTQFEQYLFDIERIVGTGEGDVIRVDGFDAGGLDLIEFIDLAGGPSSPDDGDTIDLTPIKEDVVVDLSDPMAQTARLKGGAATLNVRGAEVVRSGDGNDTIVGGPAAEFFFGGGGNDSLTGGSGGDNLTGGDGADVYLAGAGDTISLAGLGKAERERDRVDIANGRLTGADEDDQGRFIGRLGEEYVASGANLEVVLPVGGSLTVEGWTNKDAGITLFPSEARPIDSSANSSPLVLDLDGDGLELIDLDASGAFFDIDRDGFAERTGWVMPDDGLLALDRNGDGIINDVGELFGAGFVLPSVSLLNRIPRDVSGFATLGELDVNFDGAIDASDSRFAELRVWQDTNGDGSSAPGELVTLADLDIVSIELDSSNTEELSSGNLITESSGYTRGDESSGEVADVFFAYDPGDTRENDSSEEIAPEIAALPNLDADDSLRLIGIDKNDLQDSDFSLVA